MKFLRILFGSKQEKHNSSFSPDINLEQILSQIKETENQDIEPGRKIHEFDYDNFTLRLDQDITKNYRITVFQGKERVFSFTVFASQSEYEKLKLAYGEIIGYLKGEQKIADLPSSNLLKGFFYGH